ncbi:16S rRNA (cytosine(967)-C(5))-methyltransferase RsmB [Tumebacillus permanentifrigoris]|uniref:16S rRNA (cytosine(967)-C(5))-methyltransferase n=1 Tax=Tumebacillus permanentifrigoris TaxID=378543 RepID=A0A316D7T6_9BACL|nr:16S rRNA (cytosine(967)-C(5))-methyltransferase RsmB [Tumebacillus permanentifrigoris]PWK12799.1 16S rRNA (cytosine967-C5)-methyltransferase [Tumebacillus permanentifrigoris]
MKTKTATNARDLALDVLLQVETRGAYSNLALTNALRHARLDPRDVGLATELVYGTIGRINTLDYFLTPLLKTPLDKLEDWVRNLLRLSVYQLLYLDRVPPFAVINEAVEISKRRSRQASGFVNGVLRNFLRKKADIKMPSLEKHWIRRISIEHSHPEWMVKLWEQAYGRDIAEAICIANNARPKITLRVNSHRISRDELLQQLQDSGVEAHASEVSPYGILLDQGLDVTKLPAFREGLCTVQDESSMLVAQALAPEKGMRVLDCCAAPGGKTTHLAELMQDEGEVVAVDIHEHKIELIQNIADRLDLRSITMQAGDIRDVVGEAGLFDRILLDAPCSGLGVIRRKPDLKWVKVPGDIQEIADIQRDLLQITAQALKPDGVLVYSTCTVAPQENEAMIRAFLAEHPEFSGDPLQGHLPDRVLEGAEPDAFFVQIFPQQYESDGFFIARLRRNS